MPGLSIGYVTSVGFFNSTKVCIHSYSLFKYFSLKVNHQVITTKLFKLVKQGQSDRLNSNPSYIIASIDFALKTQLRSGNLMHYRIYELYSYTISLTGKSEPP